jgi:NADH-quinone oxidoreductase subunit D
MSLGPFAIEEMGEETMILFIGPQHPGSGHLRIIVELDGDVVVGIWPDIGWVHRTVEKIAETKKYIQIVPLVERPMLIDAANANLAYVRAVEKILDFEVPDRARYIRTILCEMNRISSHLYGMGIFGNMIGSSTIFMWTFGDREIMVELAQELTGARLTHSFFFPGGVRADLPEGFREKVENGLKYLESRIPHYWSLYVENPVTEARLKGVGTITKERAVEVGLTGPNLRASGIPYDARMMGEYGAYKDLGFQPALREGGDCYDRMLIRFDEIKASIGLIRGALDKIPEGPIRHEKVQKMTRLSLLKVPEGQAFSRVEGGRGEITFFVVSKGGPKPYTVRMLTPSFRNLIGFEEALIGHRLADIPAVYGSLDYFPPEADR